MCPEKTLSSGRDPEGFIRVLRELYELEGSNGMQRGQKGLEGSTIVLRDPYQLEESRGVHKGPDRSI